MMQRHRKPAHAHPCSSTHIHSAHPRQAKHSGLSTHAHAQQTHASMLHTSMTHSAHIEYAAHPQLAPPPALRATHNPEKTALMQLWPGGCSAMQRPALIAAPPFAEHTKTGARACTRNQPLIAPGRASWPPSITAASVSRIPCNESVLMGPFFITSERPDTCT